MIKYNAGSRLGVNDNNRELTLSDNNLHINPTSGSKVCVELCMHKTLGRLGFSKNANVNYNKSKPTIITTLCGIKRTWEILACISFSRIFGSPLGNTY